MVHMHMGRRDHVDVLAMLDVQNVLGELALMMVVNDGEHACDFHVAALPGLLDDPLADQVAHQLGARGVALLDDASIQLVQQGAGKGDAETNGLLANGLLDSGHIWPL